MQIGFRIVFGLLALLIIGGLSHLWQGRLDIKLGELLLERNAINA